MYDKKTHRYLNDRSYFIEKGILLKRSGDYSGALNCYLSLKKIDNSGYELEYTIAKTYYLLQDYNTALLYYKTAASYFLIRYSKFKYASLSEMLELTKEHYSDDKSFTDILKKIFPDELLVMLLDININFHIGHTLTAMNSTSNNIVDIKSYNVALSGGNAMLKNKERYRRQGFLYLLNNRNELISIKNRIYNGEEV